MAAKLFVIPILFFVFTTKVESASLIESSYEYVLNLGKNFAPSLMSIFDCMSEDEAWACAREKAGRILNGWSAEVDKERRNWQEEADAEVRTAGRSLEEMPSKLGEEVETSLGTLAEMVNYAMARAFSPRKHHESGGIDSITISTGGDKKKMKKKKPKPPKIHLIHPLMVPMKKAHKQEKGRSFPNGRQSWVIGDKSDSMVEEIHGDLTTDSNENTDDESENSNDRSEIINDGSELTNSFSRGRGLANVSEERGVLSELWAMGAETLDVLAEHALEAEDKDNGIQDKSSFAEQRGKKKKKKKAILKLLILGAVLKAKIGTLLQILSFKLQVKFFIVAVIGLAINLARLWIDIKNKHNHQPQKVIYYEHAQHQHHYDHEEEPEHGWGPWARAAGPQDQPDVELDMDLQNTPYRAQEKDFFPRSNLN